MLLISYHIKESRVYSNGECTVYATLRLNRAKVRISTSALVKPEYWVGGAEKIIGKNSENILICLNNFEDKIKEIEKGYLLTKQQYTPQMVACELKGKSKAILKYEKPVLEILREINDEKLQKDVYCLQNHRSHNTNIKKIAIFLKNKGLEKIGYNKFDFNLFDECLRVHKNCRFVKGNLVSTDRPLNNSTLKRVSQMLVYGNNWAIKRGFTQTVLIKGDKLKYEGTQTEYFTREEFVRFVALDTSANNQLDYVKDMFLLMCYTGFLMCDLRTFDPEKHIELRDGREFIIKKREKTGTEQIVPLYPEAKAIIDKWDRLDQYCELTHNRDIKVLAKLAGIDKKISVRCGRKTCGMWLINQKISIEVVSRILGHKNINVTQKHYASILIDRIDNETMHLRGEKVPEIVVNAPNMQNDAFMEMMQKLNTSIDKLANKE